MSLSFLVFLVDITTSRKAEIKNLIAIKLKISQSYFEVLIDFKGGLVIYSLGIRGLV